MTILEKIKENARSIPGQIMMIHRSSDYEERLTWKELDDYSDYLAGWIDYNLHTKTPIIVYGHKSPMMIVCFLACVKSGRAYCPIDINVPHSRIEAIVDEVQPEIILATETLKIGSFDVLDINGINEVILCKKTRITRDKFVKEDDLFYIIFTSGSTGVPKGVQITLGCLDNFIKWAIGLGKGAGSNCQRTFINQAPFSFDLSVMDLYMCLYFGGTLWALDKKTQSDMKLLIESLKDSKANVWVSTPSFADVCLSDPSFDEKALPFLDDFLFCGEILSNKTAQRLRSRFPHSTIVNTYGPTESTCAVTGITVTDSEIESESPIPVGRPKHGTWIKILKDDVEQMDGEKGEIVIVGDSVSIGYWNNAEKNRSLFGKTVVDGREYRYYKTGDEGYLRDGVLHYCGRIDLQVKLHGYRIELGDIENNLCKIDGVEQAVVIPRYRNGKVSSLAAGIVISDETNNETVNADYIKHELKSHLPEYMIPKKIVFMRTLPRTGNGKIDRKAVEEVI